MLWKPFPIIINAVSCLRLSMGEDRSEALLALFKFFIAALSDLRHDYVTPSSIAAAPMCRRAKREDEN